MKDFAAASRTAEQAAGGLAAAGGKSETVLRAMESAARRSNITVAEYEARMRAFNDVSEKAAQSQQKLAAATVAGSAASSAGATGLVRSLASYNGISLVLQAVTAASAAYFSLMQTSTPELEKSLDESARLVGLVRNAWKDAKGEAGKYFDSTREVVQLQIQLNMADLQSKIRSLLADAMKNLAPLNIDVDPMSNPTGTNSFDTSGLGKFSTDVQNLLQSIGAGAPAVEVFRDAIAKIGLANPELAETAGKMLKIAEAASQVADTYRKVESSGKINTGTGSKDDEDRVFGNRRRAPRGGAGADPFKASVDSANRHIVAMTADAVAVGKSTGTMAQLRAEAARRAAPTNDNASPRAVREDAVA